MWRLVADGANPFSAGSSSWWVRSVRVEGMDEARTQMQEVKGLLLTKN